MHQGSEFAEDVLNLQGLNLAIQILLALSTHSNVVICCSSNRFVQLQLGCFLHVFNGPENVWVSVAQWAVVIGMRVEKPSAWATVFCVFSSIQEIIMANPFDVCLLPCPKHCCPKSPSNLMQPDSVSTEHEKAI